MAWLMSIAQQGMLRLLSTSSNQFLARLAVHRPQALDRAAVSAQGAGTIPSCLDQCPIPACQSEAGRGDQPVGTLRDQDRPGIARNLAALLRLLRLPLFLWLTERAQRHALPPGESYPNVALKRPRQTPGTVKHHREFVKFI
jgi:hypothetical protein